MPTVISRNHITRKLSLNRNEKQKGQNFFFFLFFYFYLIKFLLALKFAPYIPLILKAYSLMFPYFRELCHLQFCIEFKTREYLNPLYSFYNVKWRTAERVTKFDQSINNETASLWNCLCVSVCVDLIQYSLVGSTCSVKKKRIDYYFIKVINY